MKAFAPTVDDIRQQPSLLTKKVPAEWQDVNGHMNVQYYMALFDEAGWPFFESLGMTETYFHERKLGWFDLEHHIRYLAEVLVGETVSVHARTLERTEKRLHGIWYIVNDTNGCVANSCEFISTHVDLKIRRTAPWPDDIASKIDAIIADEASLNWVPPISGLMRA